MCIQYTIHVSLHSCDGSSSRAVVYTSRPHRCEEAGVSKESLYGACCGWVVSHEIGIAPSFFRIARIALLLLHLRSRSPQDRVLVVGSAAVQAKAASGRTHWGHLRWE